MSEEKKVSTSLVEEFRSRTLTEIAWIEERIKDYNLALKGLKKQLATYTEERLAPVQKKCTKCGHATLAPIKEKTCPKCGSKSLRKTWTQAMR